MTYEVYNYIFIGSAILCGIMLIASILIFILFKIPSVISDLTGATARKAIKNIREHNEVSGEKSYKVSAINEARGKLTDKITPSGNVIRQHQEQMRGLETQQLPENQTTVLEPELQTMPLDNSEAGATTVLGSVDAQQTMPLESEPAGETTVLNETAENTVFAIEYEITFIHTDEIIQVEAM